MKITLETLKKNKLTKSIQKEYMLVTLQEDSDSSQNTFKRAPLNICLVIDVSGSMQSQIKNKEWNNYQVAVMERNRKIAEWNLNQNDLNPKLPVVQPNIWLGHNQFNQGVGDYIFPFPNRIAPVALPDDLREPIPYPVVVTKLSKAKQAAKEAVNSLIDGDIISLVVFSTNAKVIIEPTVIKGNVSSILNKIDSINIEGATNIFDGWHLGGQQIARFISSEKVNRILLLTDGEATNGIKDPDEFAQKVSTVLAAGVSTSTIGFGDSFNEVLLEAIAVSGNGNFYYVNDETDLVEVFSNEFNGIKNTAAKNIELSFDYISDVKVNNLTKQVLKEKEPGIYIIPNLQYGKSRSILLELQINNLDKSKKAFDLLKANVSYVDNNGQKHTVSQKFEVNMVSQKDYDNSTDVEEIGIQKALIEIAENQRKAIEEMQKGNMENARSMMMASMATSTSSGYNDARLNNIGATLSKGLSDLNDGTKLESVKKDLYSTSYKSLRGE